MLESLTNSASKIKLLKAEAEKVGRELSALSGQRDMTRNFISETEQEIENIESKLTDFKLIETFLSQFADERQDRVYRQLEATVTEGLQHIFNEDIRLEVSNKMVGSRSETQFNLVSLSGDEELSTSIMDSRGGGVAAVVGFLIQAVMVLLTPGLRKIVWLDETFRNVSEDFLEPLSSFIRDLCDRTGLQVVLVTHQPSISEHADKHYEFSQKNGITQIKELK